jgi:hypothetical protein
MNQYEMCYDAMSAPSRRYLAICEMQNGPNPLSDDELDRFTERQPQFADAVKAWKNGNAEHHNMY